MAWFLGDKRGPEWKQNWTSQTLSSISLPPPSLLVIFAIVLLFLGLSKSMEYKREIEKTENEFHFMLFVLPVILILIVKSMSFDSRLQFWLPYAEREAVHRAANVPWGIVAILVLLLVMVSYESSVRSHWFRPLWKSY
ncbi:hypothetical protein ACHQM5_024864 [Ranunculus cassubicifolius]